MPYQEIPLLPRDGHTLRVILMCRISGVDGQLEVSLDDQADHGREEIHKRYAGPSDFTVISTTAKGEWSDRPELIELDQLLTSRKYDVLFTEDLGRTIRGGEAFAICKLAVRHGVRVLAPHDSIDTSEPDWEETVLDACKEHTQHNAKVSKRLKQKMMNRFQKGIGAAGRLIAGYENPTGGKSYADWRKVDSATPIIREAFRILRQSQNAQAVTDFFNDMGFPVGKFARRSKWSAKLTRDFLRNSILKGMPQRGKRHTVKNPINNHRISVLNPEGPTYFHSPHLQHIDPQEFDEVNQMFDAKYIKHAAKKINGQHPMIGITRSNSRFPGLHARCWYCGRHYSWGANGKKDALMCVGPRQQLCWNSIAIPGRLTVERVIKEITTCLSQLDGFEGQYRELLEQAAQTDGGNFDHQFEELYKREKQLESERQNFLRAIRTHGPDPMFDEELRILRESEVTIKAERNLLERRTKSKPKIPSSMGEIRELLTTQLQILATESAEAIQLLRKIVPEFWVQIVQLVDGGDFEPRATITIRLANVLPDLMNLEGLESLMCRSVRLDLFTPPSRVAIYEEAARLAATGMNQRIIARENLQTHQDTVRKAIRLDRTMRSLGMSDPYAVLREAPQDYSVLRKSRNKNYHFTPVEGYVQKPI